MHCSMCVGVGVAQLKVNRDMLRFVSTTASRIASVFELHR